MFGNKSKKPSVKKSNPFDFDTLLGKAGREAAIISKDKIAELLGATPEALAAFEKSYQHDILDAGVKANSLFDVSAKQASEMISSVDTTKEADLLYRRRRKTPGFSHGDTAWLLAAAPL